MGEFVLAKDTNGLPFQVQARLAAPGEGASSYSIITEIGIQVGADVVTIDTTRPAPVWVDGRAVTFAGSTLSLPVGLITRTASGYLVTLDTGESVTATLSNQGQGLSVSVSLGPFAEHDTVEGLLGNYNGTPIFDLTLSDGSIINPGSATALYGVFANAWRVTQSTSLLDYGPGQTTATFTNTSYPSTPLSVASFPAAAVAAATQVVEQAGITDPGLQQAAIYDYLVTGDPSLLSAEANLQQQDVTTVAQTAFVPPPAPPEVGIFASSISAVENIPGPTTATFQVYLTGDTSQAVTVDYAVVAPDSTFLGPSDFGGSLPFGSVTLGPGRTSSDLSISFPGSIGTAVSKTLEVQVSAAAPAVVIGATTQETIVNAAPMAGAAPVFGAEFANDPGLLPTQNGTSWTLDLGALTQGEVFNPATLSLALLNLAGTDADDLAATIVASGDGGLPTSASPSFANLVPGGMLDIADLAIQTTSPGTHSETFTITPYDTNPTGYSETLPTQTVTVTDTVVAQAQAVAAFQEVSGGGVLTQNGTAYILYLGTIMQGATATAVVVDVVNAATAPSDQLSGSLSVAGDTAAFLNSGLGTIGPLAAGGASRQIDVTLKTGTSGDFSETLTLAATDLSGSGTSTPLGMDTLTIEGTIASPSGQAFTLTTGPDTFVEPTGSNHNTVIATANTLSAGDDIDPGSGGSNTLALQGTGVFNMTLPTTLTDIDTVQAQEGQASYVHNGVTYSGQTQIVDLRSGLNAIIDVAPAAVNAGNPNGPTITIIGAANDSSTINLASGNDAVTLGSAQETVNGGGGNNTFYVNATTIGATINGGTGTNLLEVSGGGTIAIGPNITGIADVLLVGSSTPYDFTANTLSGLLVDDLGTATADTLVAGGSNQILTGGGAGKLTMDAANQTDTLLKDSAAAFNGDTAKDLVNGDMFDITGLGFSATNTSLGFAFNSAADTTTMSVSLSGTQKTAITLLGQYMAADFTLAADTAGTGTLITLTQELNLTMPH